jgi:hypothetical protein
MDKAAVIFETCGDANYCKIARSSRQFCETKSMVSRCDRYLDFGQKLVGFERGRENALDEIRGSDAAFAPLIPYDDGCVKRQEYGWILGGGIGVCQAAANGSPRSNRKMADRFSRQCEKRCGFGYRG